MTFNIQQHLRRGRSNRPTNRPTNLRFSLIPAAALLLGALAAAQTAPKIAKLQPPAPERDAAAIALAQKALAALGPAVGAVRLEGAGQWTRNSGAHAGQVVLEALGTQRSRVDAEDAAGGGSRVETFGLDGHGRASGRWQGPDGIAHHHATHNEFVPAVWFFPALSPLAQIADPHASITYVGPGTLDGKAVEHLRFSRAAFAGTPAALKLEASLSQVEIYLDASSFLPVALTYNVHPDKGLRVNLPITVTFGDYRQAPNGGMVPYHLERHIAGSLDLSFDLQQINFAPGLAAAAFDPQ